MSSNIHQILKTRKENFYIADVTINSLNDQDFLAFLEEDHELSEHIMNRMENVNIRKNNIIYYHKNGKLNATSKQLHHIMKCGNIADMVNFCYSLDDVTFYKLLQNISMKTLLEDIALSQRYNSITNNIRQSPTKICHITRNLYTEESSCSHFYGSDSDGEETSYILPVPFTLNK